MNILGYVPEVIEDLTSLKAIATQAANKVLVFW